MAGPAYLAQEREVSSFIVPISSAHDAPHAAVDVDWHCAARGAFAGLSSFGGLRAAAGGFRGKTLLGYDSRHDGNHCRQPLRARPTMVMFRLVVPTLVFFKTSSISKSLISWYLEWATRIELAFRFMPCVTSLFPAI
jgi:hypothetical protein